MRRIIEQFTRQFPMLLLFALCIFGVWLAWHGTDI